MRPTAPWWSQTTRSFLCSDCAAEVAGTEVLVDVLVLDYEAQFHEGELRA